MLFLKARRKALVQAGHLWLPIETGICVYGPYKDEKEAEQDPEVPKNGYELTPAHLDGSEFQIIKRRIARLNTDDPYRATFSKLAMRHLAILCRDAHAILNAIAEEKYETNGTTRYKSKNVIFEIQEGRGKYGPAFKFTMLGMGQDIGNARIPLPVADLGELLGKPNPALDWYRDKGFCNDVDMNYFMQKQNLDHLVINHPRIVL